MISHRVQKRLTHEVHEALALRDKRGQSKHKDKQAARKAAQDNHTAYKTITGLYATTSLTTYARQAKTALCWIAERYGCRNLAECKEHLPAYYADMIARNLSAWTIRTRVYALCAVYAQPYQELFGVESLPIRHRADITRGRTLSASNDRYHAEHHEDARLLARACGARRGGLRGLTADGLRTDTEGNLRVHLREKGGKERDALVLPDYADRVRKIFAKYSAKPSNSKYLLPLTALPKDMPLHYLRAQYAQDLYRYFAERGTATGNMYYCRAERKGQAYDKGILLAVSQQMGHSRCDVVVCSTYQIRKIYAIGQALGIVNRGGEDALHDLVYGVTGKSSVKELSYSEACKVIGELEARQGTPPPRPKKTNHRKRKPGGVSEGQERKVWALMYRLAAASPSTVAVGDRLRAAIKKEAGVDAFADDPFAWLDYKSCNKLIEALKGYVKNAERKAGAADG